MTYPLPLRIDGIGRYLPPREVGNAELEARMGLPSGWIVRKTGVEARRWAAQDMNADWMAAQAATEALADAGLPLGDISLIINASGTSQRAIPDTAPLMQRALGLGQSGIPALSVHSTCVSFLSALEIAAALLRAGPYQHILVLSAEIASRGLDFNDPESASLFGDAATAVVLSQGDEAQAGSALLAYRMESYGDGAELTTINVGTERYPYAAGSTPQHALFHMEGKRVYRLAQKVGRGFIQRLLPDFQATSHLIKVVVPHQSTLLGIRSLKHHGVDMDRVEITLPRLGNCVAASIPATLYEAVREGRLARGDHCLFIGTGAGLSLAGALIRF